MAAVTREPGVGVQEPSLTIKLEWPQVNVNKAPHIPLYSLALMTRADGIQVTTALLLCVNNSHL